MRPASNKNARNLHVCNVLFVSTIANVSTLCKGSTISQQNNHLSLVEMLYSYIDFILVFESTSRYTNLVHISICLPLHCPTLL